MKEREKRRMRERDKKRLRERGKRRMREREKRKKGTGKKIKKEKEKSDKFLLIQLEVKEFGRQIGRHFGVVGRIFKRNIWLP
jgi:hypothetical protein